MFNALQLKTITESYILKVAKEYDLRYALTQKGNERHQLGYHMAIINTPYVITFLEKKNIQLVEKIGDSYSILYTGPSVKRCFKELNKYTKAWF